MPTYILVLANERTSHNWIARKWGIDPVVLTSNCNYNPAVNQLFNKDPRDLVVPCPCTNLIDPLGNLAPVIMVKLAN